MTPSVLKMQKVVQSIAIKSRRSDLAFTLGAKWADGNVGPSTAAGVNLALGTKYSVAFVRGNPISLTQRLLKVAQSIGAPKVVQTAPFPTPSMLPPTSTPTNEVLKMQRLVQSIAQIALKKGRRQLVFTLGPKWADGRIGPSTANGVNIALGTKYSVAFVRGNVASITRALLNVLSKAGVPIVAPTPMKDTSRTIPITTDVYLLFQPKIGYYDILKKTPGKPAKLGEIHVFNISHVLKITGRFAVATAADMRKRLPPPSNSYAVLLNGKPVLKRGIAAVPPPVSPFVSPLAPPGSTLPPRSLPSVPETEAYLRQFFAQTAVAGEGWSSRYV